MKYTIIVTVYNKEVYLEKCLNSVCNQTYKDYCIMVVNDGSTDNSEEIINRFREKYKIEYYSKQNTGIADTRNYAIDKVKTDYFLFVDADDYISLELLETVDKYDNYDMLSFNAINLDESMKVIKNINKPEFKGNGEEYFIKLVKNKSEFTVPWGYIYNTNYFRKQGFIYPKGRILEDYYLTPSIIIESKRLIAINYCGYYYISNEKSIINNKENKKEMQETYFEYFEQLNLKINESNYSEKTKKIYKKYLVGTLIWYGTTLEEKEQKEYVKTIKNKNIKIDNKLIALFYNMNLYYKIRKYIKKLNSNKGKIISNYIYNTIYQLVIVISPLITMPYKSRILGPENIGIYSYVISVFSYLLMFGSLGISLYGRREIAYVKDDKYKRSKILYELLILKSITLIIAILTFGMFLDAESNYIIFYLIMLMDLLFNIFDLTWFYQGIGELKKLSLVNLFIKTLNIICIFIFIKTSEDLIKYFILTVIFDIVSIVLLWTGITKYIQKIKLSELKIFKNLKMCIILFIPQIFINIYTVCDKIMLGNLSNNIEEVGFYENSNKIIRLSLNVINSLVAVMIPVISHEFKNKNNQKIKQYMNLSIEFVIFMALPLMFGIIGISNNLVLVIFGEQYTKMIEIIRTLSLIIIPVGITSIIGEQYLVSIKKEKQFTLYIMIGAITNVILNLVLIPKYSVMGATIATVLTEWLVFVMEFPVIKKIIDLKQMMLIFIKYLLCSLVMFLIIYVIGTIKTNMIVLITQLLVGIIIYFLILLILKDKYMKSIMEN